MVRKYDLTENTAHEAEAKNLLLQQFHNKPLIEALVTSFVEQVQELETVFFQLINQRSLDASVGEQLDNLGTILNVERLPSESDTDYRQRLRVEILVILSSGTVEDVLSIVAMLTTSPMELLEGTIAEFELELFTPIANGPLIASFVQRAKAAAVRAVTVWVDSAFAPPYFAFAGGDPADAGFGSGAFVTASD